MQIIQKYLLNNTKIKNIFTIFFLLTLPNLLFGAISLEQMVSKVVEFTNSTLVKSVLTLIIIAISIYAAKNHDRGKEIIVMCITIILALVALINAGAIANALFS